jgi:hypothetical protein
MIISSLIALLLPTAFAAIGDIACVAEQYDVTRDGLKNHVKQPLQVEQNKGSVLILSTEIDGRAYVLSGNTVTGDFRLTQAWGHEYRHGFNTTASFNSSGRLQISEVRDELVFKLVCNKIQASDFPNE